MKYLLVQCIFAMIVVPQMFSQSKIAIFDPDGSSINISENVKTVVREEVSQVIVNNQNDYILLERALIDKVLQESRFQGKYSESDASELGKLLGAKYVCIVTIVKTGSGYAVFCKQVDVGTAVVLKQGQGTSSSLSDIAIAAKEAALCFAKNQYALKNEIDQERKKLGKEESKKTKKSPTFRHQYTTLSIGNGVTYGRGLGIGINYIFGILGLEAGIGSARIDTKSSTSSDKDKISFEGTHYSVGIKCVVYRNVFLSAHYGVLGVKKEEASNNSKGEWSTGGSTLYNGGSAMIGYSSAMVSDGFFTLGFGISKPTKFDKFQFAWNVGYGFIL